MASKFRFRRSFGNVSSRFRGAIPKHFPLFTGLLDDFSGAAVAWSLKALSRDWLSQPVINARRGGDDVTLDFNESELTDGTIVAWASAGSGDSNAYVGIVYDQSGNSNNLLQSTTAQQRKIVDTGVLVTEGGEPAIAGNIYAMNMTSAISFTAELSILMLANIDATEAVLGRSGANQSRIRSLGTTIEVVNNAAGEINFINTNNAPSSHTFDGSRVLVGLYRDSSDSMDCTIAGNSVASGPLTLAGTFQFDQLFARAADVDPMNNNFQEIIIWPSDIR